MNLENQFLLKMRACVSSYINFIIIFCIPISILVLASFKSSSCLKPIYLFSLAFLLFIIWLSFFKVTVTEEVISYRTLFGGTKSIRFDEIQKVQILFGWFKYSDRFKPMRRIAIEPIDSQRKIIYINMKVFSIKELNKLFDIMEKKLGDKCKF